MPLTIAEASGLIAAGVMIIQYLLPAALVVIMVKYVGVENKAVTWSVVNRTIATTIWPHLLRADSVANRSAALSAKLPGWVLTFSAMLLVVASVVAPLGLYEEIRPSNDLVSVPFQYVKDPGPFGVVTMPRPDTAFSRVCDYGRAINCPGQYQGVYMEETEPGHYEIQLTDADSTINTTIPANLTKIFSSATADLGNTLSGLFDIQYRRWTFRSIDLLDKGRPSVRADSRYVGKLATRDELLLVEGLVVDMRNNPGIGFRNHTIPQGLEFGGQWTEDLTWIEPVTECADTNLTIELQRSEMKDWALNNSFEIIDRGAFTGLEETVLESPIWNDNQTLDLYGRAHLAARMYNVFVASSMNISLPLANDISTVPRIAGFDTDTAAPYTYLESAFDFARIQAMTGIGGSPFKVPDRYGVNSTVPFENGYPDGRKKLLALNYTAINQICKGYYEVGDTTLDWRANNISYPGVECGVIIGAPVEDPRTNLTVESYTGVTTRQKNVYVCASSLRAGIKTVTFRYNKTNGDFSDLVALDVRDKVYPPDDPEAIPLWASEHSYDLRMRFEPLWGLVSNEHERTTNSYESGIYTHRAEKLWLPVSPFQDYGFGEVDGYDSLAMASGFARRLGALYNEDLGAPDYSGDNDYALAARWQRLSGNASSASQIPRLIATDTLVSALVGTKKSTSRKYVEWPASLAVDEDDSAGVLPSFQIQVYRRVVLYDLRYAIPGFVVLAILLVALVWSLVIFLVASPHGSFLLTMRDLYNQTSTGRLAAALLLRPEHHSDPRQSTSRWAKGDGLTVLRFGAVGYISASSTSAGKPRKDDLCEVVGTPPPQHSNGGSVAADGADQTLIRVQPK